jgi:hypothetical protein
MIKGLLKLLCPGLFFIFIENVTHSLELVFKKRVSTAGPPLLNLTPEQALEELSK